MNTKSPFHGRAVKLYVFVDTINFTSEFPRIVIISKFKCIADLRKEFSENHDYPAEEQYWIINNSVYPDEMEIAEIIKEGDPFKNGYITYLFIIDKAEKNRIPVFIDTYLEDKYSKVNPDDRWNNPQGNLIIISDTVDASKPLATVGWTCEACTFLNKAYNECCGACGYSRPLDYEIPKNLVITKEEHKIMLEQEKEKERQKQLKEEENKKMAIERDEYRKRIELMYKEKIAYSTEPSECPICAGDFEPGEAIVLHGCHHVICKDCLKGYLTTATDPKVTCPTENCVGILEDGEISGILTEEEYKKYEQLNLRTAESKIANTFHCKTPNCTAWVIYDDDVNFFDCPICIKKNCILCAAIHDGQTCKEYQEEMEIKARNDVAAKKDLEFLDNLIKTGQAMKCPGCKIIVQKKSGCDWMQCNMCKTEICWATKGPRWGPKGRGDTSGGCKCRVNNQPCIPTCGNCH